MLAFLNYVLGRRGPGTASSVSLPVDLQDLIDALPVGVALFDASLCLQAANDSFASLLGLTPERLEAGMSFTQLVEVCRAAPSAGASNCPGLLMMDGKVPAQPRRFERVTLGGRVLELQASALEGGGLMLAAQDITPLRAVQAQLRAAQAAPAADAVRARQNARAALEARTREESAAVREMRQRFVGGISHDLRTPLNAVIGFLQLARGTMLTPVQADYLSKAAEAAKALMAVVGDGLDELDALAPATPPRAVAGVLAAARPVLASVSEHVRAPAIRNIPELADLGPKPLAGLRILLAEDNLNNQIVARELLTGQGARVEIAVDGLDTLSALVAGGEFDAILMDWQMPNMDGLEATREIRRLVGSQHVPVIALTANATPSDRRACLDAGMNAHLAKPVDVASLVHTLLQHTRPGSLLSSEPLDPFDAHATNLTPRAPILDEGEPASTADATRDVMFELTIQPLTSLNAPVLDREGALERLGGNVELYDQVVQQFRLEVPNLLVDIADAARGGQRAHVRRLAHTLKSTAATVGARALSQAAHEVESSFTVAPDSDDPTRLTRLDAAASDALRVLPAPWELADMR